MKKEIENTGHLCSVYCPICGKVTDKISFNLLREAGVVDVICHKCFGKTVIEYSGRKVTLWHYNEDLEKYALERIEKKKGK